MHVSPFGVISIAVKIQTNNFHFVATQQYIQWENRETTKKYNCAVSLEAHTIEPPPVTMPLERDLARAVHGDPKRNSASALWDNSKPKLPTTSFSWRRI
jgi:hypothetical protein